MTKPVVSIIIVNRNGEKYLHTCLHSLLRVKNLDYELILVDNNSTDRSQTIVTELFHDAVVISNTANKGYALPNNQGADRAKGKYLLFLNNDTEVTPGFLRILVDEMEADNKLGVCQPKILLLRDRRRLDAIGSYLTASGFLYHWGFHKLDTEYYAKSRTMLTPRGACMLIRKNIFVKAGGFDADYFAYFEETDLCWRIWLMGYTVKYIPEAIVYHERGGTSISMQSSLIQYHSFKNRICTLLKNLSGRRLLYILPFHILLCMAGMIAYVLTGRYNIAGSIVRAFWWNTVHLNGTLEKRKHVQNQLRIISDSSIWPSIYKSVTLSYYLYLFTGLERYQDEH